MGRGRGAAASVRAAIVAGTAPFSLPCSLSPPLPPSHRCRRSACSPPPLPLFCCCYCLPSHLHTACSQQRRGMLGRRHRPGVAHHIAIRRMTRPAVVSSRRDRHRLQGHGVVQLQTANCRRWAWTSGVLHGPIILPMKHYIPKAQRPAGGPAPWLLLVASVCIREPPSGQGPA